MLTHTCTTDLKQINPLNGSTSERLAFTRMWYILCAITYMCTTDLKRINYPAQWEHTSVELCLLSFIFLYLLYCSGLFHQCSHICETGYCSLVPEKWDWKSGIQSGIKWMGLLNVFHLIWLSGQTTLSLSLSVSEGAHRPVRLGISLERMITSPLRDICSLHWILILLFTKTCINGKLYVNLY